MGINIQYITRDFQDAFELYVKKQAQIKGNIGYIISALCWFFVFYIILFRGYEFTDTLTVLFTMNTVCFFVYFWFRKKNAGKKIFKQQVDYASHYQIIIYENGNELKGKSSQKNFKWDAFRDFDLDKKLS